MLNRMQCFVAEVQEVHSGDDMIILIDLGVDNLFKKVRARLHGVDTPDAYKEGPDTEAGRLRDRVKHLVKGKNVCIEVHNKNQGKGGWLITMYFGVEPEGESLNTVLRDEGYIF